MACASGEVWAEQPPLEVTISDNARALKCPSREPSTAGSVITRDRLQAPLLEAQDVLRTQPGVIITETAGVASPATATIRGASAADTPVYLGGVRLNDDVGGSADLSMVPLWLVQRVEIYRGHAPLEADRFAPGGAIFVDPVLPRKTQAGVGTSVGSWGSSAAHAYVGSKQERLGYLVGISGTRAANRYPYEDDGGLALSHGTTRTVTRENADVTRIDSWVLGRYDLGRAAHIQLLANFADRELGVPRLAVLQSRQARQHSTRQLIALNARVPLTPNALLDAQTSVLLGKQEYDDPLGELSLRVPELSVSGRRLEQSLAGTFELSSRVRIRPQVLISEDTIERIPSEASFQRARRLSGRAAVRAEARILDTWSLHSLLSGECHSTALGDSNCDQSYVTGRIGSELEVRPLRFYVSAGRYVRLPTLGELHGVSGAVHGNRDLLAETGLSADVGVRSEVRLGRSGTRAYFDGFGFARDANHLIAYTPTGQGFIRPYNVGRARVLGAEILTGIELLRFLHLETAVTWLDPRDRTKGRSVANEWLPYRSRLLVSPRIRAAWQWPSRNGISSFGTELSAVYQSSRYADRAGLALIDAQTSVDANAYLGWFDEMLHLRVRVADLFDQKRTDLVGYPLPRRSVYVGLDAHY